MNNLLLAGLYIVQTVAIRIGLVFGGDYDENGCKPSAGYMWCNETSECTSINQLCLPDTSDILLNLTLSLTPVLEN